MLVGPPAAASADGTAFTHRVTSWNISGNLTRIDHPLLNGNRNARLIVTPSYNPDQPRGVYNNRTLGVFYDGRMWGIYNDTGGNVSLGAAFNVLVPRDQSNPPAGPIGGGGTVSQGG